VKAALQEVVKRKHEIELLAAKRRQLDGQIKAIGEEQARIRQNMDRLDRTSELYKRYVGKFTEQEDQIESLREQIQELQSQENQFRKSLDEYLMGLDLQ
jgi:chromosome segregation ATPase